MIHNDILNIIDDLLVTVRDKYIPIAMQSQYYNCDIALQDYMKFEDIAYYAQLQKLKIAMYGIGAVTTTLPRKRNALPLAINTDTTYIDVLNTDEYADAGFNRPVQNVYNSYVFYTLSKGETLKDVALKFYGEYDKWTIIAQANGIYDSTIIDYDMTGKIIRVPINDTAYIARSENNLVYEPDLQEHELSFSRYLCGRDIALQNTEILRDGKYDIAVVEGNQCVISNIKDRLLHAKGSLNPMHPDWGVDNLDSNTNYIVAIYKMLNDVKEQVLADPRVADCVVDLEGIHQDGIYVNITITTIAGHDETIGIKV